MATADQWLATMARLKIDRAKGPAPHKPLLLLVLLDRAAQGLLPDPTLPLTPELAFPFYSSWTIVAHRHRGRERMKRGRRKAEPIPPCPVVFTGARLPDGCGPSQATGRGRGAATRGRRGGA
jgi:hypothetical protein